MGEKYLQIILSDKGSILKIYEELIELNSKITVLGVQQNDSIYVYSRNDDTVGLS